MSRLKEIRERSGMSQAKLSEVSGVNKRMIQHYEQGFKDINHGQAIILRKLSEALGCKIEDIMEP